MSITIAIPKGRLGDQVIEQFQNSQIGNDIDLQSRKLIFEDTQNGMKFVLLKNSDVITYVENGIADIGIVGSDMIEENKSQVYCLKKLDIGKCKIAVAGRENSILYSEGSSLKVATKFPNIAQKYFKSRGQNIKIIKLNGSIELAPLMGLSDVIVDIVETGSTLKANELCILEEICEVSGYIISNQVSYKFKKEKIDRALSAIERRNIW